MFLLENVEGLAYAKKSEGLELLLSLVDDINRRAKTHYHPSFQVVKAADHGVPQLRERFFMVAARDGGDFRFPSPAHGPIEARKGQLQLSTDPPYRTRLGCPRRRGSDPTEDLEVKGKWADLLPSIPEGENYLWHTDRGGGMPLFGWRRRYWSFLLKLAKDKPSWTIQAQPGPAIGPFHWKNRRLSMRELCRLQTFPDDVVSHRCPGAVQTTTRQCCSASAGGGVRARDSNPTSRTQAALCAPTAPPSRSWESAPSPNQCRVFPAAFAL